MKSIIVTILCCLINTATSALIPHKATYTLSWSGIKVGVDNRKLTVKNNLYHYQSNAKSTGFGKLIKDYNVEAEAILSIDHSGVNAGSYRVLEVIDDVIKKNIAIELKNDDLDPLSLFLALSNEIKNNPAKINFKFRVNDGKKIEWHHYQIMKSDDANTIKIIEKDKNIELHFSKNQNALFTYFRNSRLSLKLKSVIFEE
ncbi:MAG: hypothetical protein DSZ14_08645 [Candidatus Thioglobus sp.]|nr:MAG: hypothetical protein DSZ14_08645 [Candidatus Thioglobus sp.]